MYCIFCVCVVLNTVDCIQLAWMWGWFCPWRILGAGRPLASPSPTALSIGDSQEMHGVYAMHTGIYIMGS